MAKSWKQLCLFCRGEGIVCLEKEGDLGTYVDCNYCDAGLHEEEYENVEQGRPDPARDYRDDG